MLREVGFYYVTVTEHGPPFNTIGLWTEFGSWYFAQGDGNEMGTYFTIVSVDENMIMKDREYVNGDTK